MNEVETIEPSGSVKELPPAILFKPGDRVLIPTLRDILTADPDQFVATYTDIAAVNLACAEGLVSSQPIDIPKYLSLLDTIAAAVRTRVEKTGRLFKLKPAEFKNSESVFRVMTLEHVSRIVFGVKYDSYIAEITRTGKPRTIVDSSEIFIHGILSDKQMGTCSSLPVFSIAVGRRCGYPLTLVRVPIHCLYRWHDNREMFNYQHTDIGGETRPDHFYHTSPYIWDAECHKMNARTKVWLHSLTAKQEVSKFLCHRALCLRQETRYPEALQAIRAAKRFDSINPACDEIAYDTLEKMNIHGFPPMFRVPLQFEKEIA